MSIPLDQPTDTFEPKIVGFLCNWCSYAGADKAGASQLPYPPNISVIRVMCSGRVDPQFVLEAFHKGADGVLILACHPGDCHYKEGNFRAAQRHRMLLRLLTQFGIEKERCNFDYVSAGEGEKFAKVMTEMVETIKGLGPAPRLARNNAFDGAKGLDVLPGREIIRP
jgi:F420-non-reducing hydrogenase iron-sulfur subunit